MDVEAGSANLANDKNKNDWTKEWRPFATVVNVIIIVFATIISMASIGNLHYDMSISAPLLASLSLCVFGLSSTTSFCYMCLYNYPRTGVSYGDERKAKQAYGYILAVISVVDIIFITNILSYGPSYFAYILSFFIGLMAGFVNFILSKPDDLYLFNITILLSTVAPGIMLSFFWYEFAPPFLHLLLLLCIIFVPSVLWAFNVVKTICNFVKAFCRDRKFD